jgi:alkylation response protein AidB-like acyl-CoA dehydrogenase
MQLELSEDEVALRDAIDRVFEDAQKQGAVEEARKQVWSDLSEMGWLALPISEAKGGAGCSLLETGMLMQAAGRQGLVTPFLSSILLGAGLLARVANSEKGDEILAQAMQGRLTLALAHHEGDQFAPEAPSTTAVRSKAGWRLRGVKHLCFGGADADWIIISSSTEEGLAIFLLAADAVERTRIGTLRGEDAADIRLDIELGPEALIAAGPTAEVALRSVINEAILALCWEAAGAMASLLEQTVAYTNMRVQFGRPLSALQSVQHRLAEMAVVCEEAQSIVELATFHAGSGEGSRFASAAKAHIGRGARYVAETAVQLHGGIGVTEELSVARYFRLLLAFEASLGSSNDHLTRYASETVLPGLHLQSAVLR